VADARRIRLVHASAWARTGRGGLQAQQVDMVRKQVQRLVDDNTGAGRAFDLFFQFLIVASLVTFVVDGHPGLNPEVSQGLHLFSVFTVIAFTVEYLLRIWASPRPLRFVLSFWGIIDLLAVLPFYLGTTLDLRSLRVFRLLRLLRTLKLLRYGQTLLKLHRAFVLIRSEITLFVIASSMLLYIVSVGIYYCEREAQPELFGSMGGCLWWAIVTLTTVGYGDAYPITAGGRIFTSFVLVMGLGIVAVPSGMVASALSQVSRELAEERNRERA